ncbi:hypothetical protein GPECTOR_67g328 [Gonium pectorale]|uniref:type I protein arginine methyltransferase n=1 Tax=Gonium pectorale TaxID=33097 RepID=A0A150G3R3_GONPE|nr:hypothetical protein GPECTOR_67g328 [Gonium pectorale]|eukprot:KXZ44487.1 hypothetical protein GPECTOR_67g328 [Gonium pectorale]
MSPAHSFEDLRVASVHAEAGSVAWESAFKARLVISRAGDSAPVINVENQATGSSLIQCILSGRTAWRAAAALFFVSPLPGGAGGTLYAVQCANKSVADQLQAALDAAVAGSGKAAANGGAASPSAAGGHAERSAQGGVGSNGGAAAAAGAGSANGAGPGPPWNPPRSPLPPPAGAAEEAGASAQRQRGADATGNGNGGDDEAVGGAGDPSASNHFDRKICRASSDMYFHYYGMLQHQQNMLQDYTRTGTYYQAIVGNPDDFRGRTVMDVGAGSGILSLFAAQAGAARVYAVEASGMAAFARRLADANPALGSRITIINSKVEEVSLPERVDVLVSEPMGTLLVNERMLESYIFARDAFLKPGGKMFPQLGRIHAAAFSDEVLHAEVAAKSAFWMQPAFYGVDVTALHGAATEGYFGQVVVDAFEPSVLVSSCASRLLDFGSVTERELLDIDLPLQLVTGPVAPLTVHGLACWFDVFFAGAQLPVWLTTAPGMPTTHWFQLRCVLQTPLLVAAPNTRITGRLHLVAHARQSYDIFLTLTAPPLAPGQPPQTSTGKFDLKEPYYRQLTPYGAAAAAAAAGFAGTAVAGDAGAAAATGGAGGAGWGW